MFHHVVLTLGCFIVCFRLTRCLGLFGVIILLLKHFFRMSQLLRYQGQLLLNVSHLRLVCLKNSKFLLLLANLTQVLRSGRFFDFGDCLALTMRRRQGRITYLDTHAQGVLLFLLLSSHGALPFKNLPGRLSIVLTTRHASHL